VTVPARDDKKPQPEPLAVVDLGTAPEPALIYVGPKDYEYLGRVGHRLKEVVPVGDWIGPIVVMLMSLLRWVHSHVLNYGWSIVLLTVLINLAMAPLRHYSIANGVKMAKIAPEMKVIQDRYRKLSLTDPKRQDMQQEMGELYARHGMNMSTQMMVGCLPLLLTMPFLIAFYRVLQVSIELRGASFLWIPDLSTRDPLFITPVLMGLSMFVMQRITPTTMDPAQQRVMMVMPIMFMVMFFAAPAGLNLYWLASNVCSILQQGVTLTIIRGREGEPPAARDKRRK
jgi:YidC/Oxa1 family membrane protein insertase